ncbi:hypothetical protein [Brevibacterium linens]|uniref:Uncharacterized protein n=1 Tax=Brevibacterium linens TaxID=1703 RepID=A0A0B9A1P9_BRELN|nr:hypothetical protein [Brevibacterium linens]KHS52569.1 hypothetical protein AE0388_1552 [Brevibacterium linens]
MSDQDNLRDRIEDALRDGVGLSWRNKAQAIIDEFGLTVHGDDCGYHEIHGSYDTSFEARQ